uniref:Rho guanine nucleotide exchange factor 38 n=1 Tax=Varanus komodoensis TaxID=61221 RepID=A0A8D2Q1V8_VARKO
MAPQAGSSGLVGSPLETEEQLKRRMMAKRQKIIAEMIQTEKDYLNDLELCIRTVVEPLRRRQVRKLDVDGLFSNIESVYHISTKLLSALEEATANVEPAMQIKDLLEDAYKIYCYHHDDAHMLLECYEKDEELKQHIRDCLQSLKIYCTANQYMGSLMIKPIQRVMKYPLLLCELLNATPLSHPDHKALQDAVVAVKAMNMNINELKRRKDIVLKYKKNDEDESLKEKFSRLNIHSISKKSKRVTSHLKILTGGEPQVKDGTFNKEEKLFRSLEKAVKLCVKNISLSLQHLEAKQVDKMALTPLSALQALFIGPQKLIQKRYDKLLDYNSYHQKTTGDEMDLAKREYEALNAQLVEELQRFNRAAKKIITNCLCCFITLLRDMMASALRSFPSGESLLPVSSLKLSPPSICEVQCQVLEEVQNLNFVKENNSINFIERKLSFEKKKPAPPQSISKNFLFGFQPEFPRQTESHRSMILATYSVDLLYQAKRKCNATQEFDIDLYEGEVVAVVEQKDPFGSTSRWLVDTGVSKGYVYSSFLKPYNPSKAQKDAAEATGNFCNDDFDNISLFVSSRQLEDSCTKPAGHKRSSSGSSYNSLCEKTSINGTEVDSVYETDDQKEAPTWAHTTFWQGDRIQKAFSAVSFPQTFYAVHAFQARSQQELSLQEYQRVRILRFSDLSGNKEWWLAEAKGQKGYVPANYLGKMTYA